MQNSERPTSALVWIALFTSFGTLICCALPAMLVALGAGAVVAGLVTAVPQVVAISIYKDYMFAGAGVLLLTAAVMRYATRNAPCPIDPHEADACRRLRRLSGWILGAAGLVYAVGFFFAYIAIYVLG
ncbi:MAG: hypothetical protein LCH56_05070 [Proteobacteria bacterium]|nr:hypothetical protein [Pseudomonadota bacterium]